MARAPALARQLVGLFAVTTVLAVFAGLCAFVIDYDQFPRARARQRALLTGVVAASFFAALGALLVFALLH